MADTMQDTTIYPAAWIFRTDGALQGPQIPMFTFLLGCAVALVVFSALRALYRIGHLRKSGHLPEGSAGTAVSAGASLAAAVGFFLSYFGIITPAAGFLIGAAGLFCFVFGGYSAMFRISLNRPFPRWLAALMIGVFAAALFLPPVLSRSTEAFLPPVLGVCVILSLVTAARSRNLRGFGFFCVVLVLLGASFYLDSFFPLPIFLWALALAAWNIAGPNFLAGKVPGPAEAAPAASGETSPGDQDPADSSIPEILAAADEQALPDSGYPQGMSQVSSAINPFIPKEFLTILNKTSVMDLQLGDHTKQEMTIFFSDIRQFTDLSEQLTPEESFKFINSYLSRIVPVITEQGGFIDKYIGDAILALYPQDNGADSAVRSAIEIQKKLVEYNYHRSKCGYRALSMGIGLHTGTLMLGVVGVEDRMQNTVISDAVNLTSRLESITKVFNISLAISEETFKKLEDPGSYMYRFIGKVRVKGKVDPVSVFEIFDGIDPSALDRKMQASTHFEEGMIRYYQKNFPEALGSFRKVLEILPEDGASIFYLDNCMAKLKVPAL
ncbi:adenylate/guanylate cyclase domain-containing protein [Breznakiella homolactica]|uniref:Guanylate cyclase domain-containing protein n=1 Tax=Breznakiella homolactica TaxID=2798577 RepID=A0A7T7XKS9_9SPIR|nr:adenylate/guanylate cyclase domain-containing protein [Breznakiella homolactica]QQO08234.1 hypothetical protein JFL75_15015 [Breznakiella homolactica]